MNLKIVISASRRTDIPAFYMPWFMDAIKKGAFEVVNPFNRKVRHVPAGPEAVHTIVFWSKDFGPFIDGNYGKKLKNAGYHLFFNFTVNSSAPVLEPHVPALENRLRQMQILAESYDPLCINWRFDPICFFGQSLSTAENNMEDFAKIAHAAHAFGIRRCITSFMDHYPKIDRRLKPDCKFSFIDPAPEKKAALLSAMAQQLENTNLQLHTCCEPETLSSLPSGSNVTPAACIPNDFLKRHFGGHISLGKDRGQRVSRGCGCMQSVDVGSYELHPCYHNCRYCYANPSPPPGDGISSKNKLP